MRKTVALVIGWLLAGVGAVALATMAVGAVGDRLTDQRPAALSATEVRNELDDAATTTTTTASPPPPPTTPAGPPTSVDDHGGSGGSDDNAAPGSGGGSGGTGPTVVTTPTTTSRPTTPSSTTKTFAMVGGTATLRFSPAGVTVVTATPKAGYQVDIEPDHGNGVRVEFENDTHRSRVSGWWDGGPRSDTREDTSGGGDGGSGGPG